MVIATKIKEWSRSDLGIQTDPRRSTTQHGQVGQWYQVRQLDVSVDATMLRNKVLYQRK